MSTIVAVYSVIGDEYHPAAAFESAFLHVASVGAPSEVFKLYHCNYT